MLTPAGRLGVLHRNQAVALHWWSKKCWQATRERSQTTTASQDRVVIVCVSQAVAAALYAPPVSVQAKWQQRETLSWVTCSVNTLLLAQVAASAATVEPPRFPAGRTDPNPPDPQLGPLSVTLASQALIFRQRAFSQLGRKQRSSGLHSSRHIWNFNTSAPF